MRLYRQVRPVPKSPEPRSPEEETLLPLVPSEAFTRRMIDLLRFLQSRLPEGLGHYAEFGVYNGTSMLGMFRAMTRLGIDQPTLFGFDSFQGLPPEVVDEDGGVWRAGQFNCPMHVALENLAKGGVPLHRVLLTPGWYKTTLSEPASQNKIGPVSIVMVDSDACSSARLALRFIEPVLTRVSVIIFDDWKLNDLDLEDMGEYRAFREFLADHPYWKVVLAAGYNRKSKVAILSRT